MDFPSQSPWAAPVQGSGNAKRAVGFEGFVALGLLLACGFGFSWVMGFGNFCSTLMHTAYRLLMDTVLYLTAISVMTGAISSVLMEFGVGALLDRLLAPVMKPLYNMPGVAALGAVTAYLSDNPAVVNLMEERDVHHSFTPPQRAALTNLGASFGMGLIVTVFMLGLTGPDGKGFLLPVLIGHVGVIGGSVCSVRLMLWFASKQTPLQNQGLHAEDIQPLPQGWRRVRGGSYATRLINAIMDGGRAGVRMGATLIPGVLVLCTLVMMLTYGAGANGYTGEAYQGIALLPWLGEKLQFLLSPLLGFTNPAAIAVPVTALGSAGAAVGLIPGMLATGQVTGGNIAVFTAMCISWGGYLSTHATMMNSLGYPGLIGKAVLFHALGGLVSGICAHFLYELVQIF